MLNKKPQKRIRLTRFGKWLVFLACFLLFSAQNTGNNLLYLVCSCILTSFIFSFIDLIMSMRGFKAELYFPKIAQYGQQIEIICKIEKLNYTNRYFVRFEDSWLEIMKKGNDYYLKKTLRLDRLGNYLFKDFSIIKPSMLDIFYFQYVFPEFSIVTIYDYDNKDLFVSSNKNENEKIYNSYEKDGDYYAFDQYQEGMDASYINWSVSARSDKDWVAIREKESNKNTRKTSLEDKQDNNSAKILEENIEIKGKTYNEIASESLKKELNSSIYRIMVVLALLACFGIYSTGFLQNLIYVLTALFIVLGLKGSSLKTKSNNYAYFSCIIVAVYILIKMAISSSIPKIVLLLEFSVLILFLQYLTMKNIRNIFGALTLVFMILLGIAAMNINSAFPAVLLPFILLSSMIFAFLRINLVSTESKVRNKFAVYPRGVLGTLFLFIVFTFLWIPFFYLIPRTTSYGIASNLSEQRKTKGFSEHTLNLNDSSYLEDNLTVVMRIIPNEEKTISPAFLRRLGKKLIRGSSFSEYENGEWKKLRRYLYVKDLHNSSGELLHDKKFTDFKNLHSFDIVLEDSDIRNVFVPSQTKKINFQSYYIGIESDGTLFFADRRSIFNRRYMVSMLIDEPEIIDSSIDELLDPEPFLLPYLSLNGISDRILNLSNSFASSSQSIVERANKTMNFLHKNCSYSLEFGDSVLGQDPVDNFIFGDKLGNCQHFATAFCFLLRGMGIPARVVNGYMMGEWNDIGGFFTVRQSNAHAWVEVFFPKSGWVTFDPTPQDTSNEKIGFFKRTWDKLLEVYEGYWFNYIYSFDMKSQSRIKKNFVLKELKKLSRYMSSPYFWGISICIVLFLFLIRKFLRSIYKYLRKSSRWLPFNYVVWENSLSVERLPSETPYEFHNRLINVKIIDSDSRSILKEVENLIDEYAFKKDASKFKIILHISRLLKKVRL